LSLFPWSRHPNGVGHVLTQGLHRPPGSGESVGAVALPALACPDNETRLTLPSSPARPSRS